MLGTPCRDGRAYVEFFMSVLPAVQLAAKDGIGLFPVFVCYDSLIQRARNDLVAIALETDCDDLIFIDDDMEFDPNWIISLLNRPQDVVGGTARKKIDTVEQYAVKMNGFDPTPEGLIKVHGLGTGFVKISKKALKAVWDISAEYRNEGKVRRMVFDIGIVNGDLMSEDTFFTEKLEKLGFESWLDPTMTCPHIGIKKYMGDVGAFIDKVRNQAVS